MSEDLNELYQSIILDHNKAPRNYGLLDAPTHKAEGYNPICGDKIIVTLQLDTERFKEVRFQTASCAICKASASIMAVALRGKYLSELEVLEILLNKLLAGEELDGNALSTNSDLAALSGVSKFPSRIKCAKLPWQTLHSALKNPI
jgi:nitrogen fixation NifU-like protein